MAEQDRADAPDRFAHGSGHTETHEAEKDGFRPGVTGGGQTTLPDTGRAEPGSAAGHAEGWAGAGAQAGADADTVGAVGEMDFTGQPAGPGGGTGPSGGSAAGGTQGGGPGGGAVTSGGVGAGVKGPGPQSIESTTAALGDMEPSAGTGEGGPSRAETAGDKS
jgi:hypothetical protein